MASLLLAGEVGTEAAKNDKRLQVGIPIIVAQGGNIGGDDGWRPRQEGGA
eukprot:CAMPEP_0185750386 /NCGR_PEP_ID=MMETSP1174-20130828/9161_1 /TAXON_ID=35687 /ORGANISM="Dictyocha speculum, Strain CCMP1381" /LENGTH=49 /DNA_ID= /DNA_START= /DNA_END= /DNA_ORIENTATION=